MSSKRKRAVVAQNDEPGVGLSAYSFKQSDTRVQKTEKSKTGRSWKALKQVISAERYDEVPSHIATYTNIEAGPSSLPLKKYCDISGLEAKYTEPRTRLRYASAEYCHVIRALPNDHVQALLAIRNATIQLK